MAAPFLAMTMRDKWIATVATPPRNDSGVEVPDFKLCFLINLVIANEIGPRANVICVGDK